MFLDRSWPIRGGAADIYMPLITIRRTVTEKNYMNEVFYSYRKKGLKYHVRCTLSCLCQNYQRKKKKNLKTKRRRESHCRDFSLLRLDR